MVEKEYPVIKVIGFYGGEMAVKALIGKDRVSTFVITTVPHWCAQYYRPECIH